MRERGWDGVRGRRRSVSRLRAGLLASVRPRTPTSTSKVNGTHTCGSGVHDAFSPSTEPLVRSSSLRLDAGHDDLRLVIIMAWAFPAFPRPRIR